jgi:hypothetical protein
MTSTDIVTVLLVLVVVTDVVRWQFFLLMTPLMDHFFMMMMMMILGNVIDCCWRIESWMVVSQMRGRCHCVVMMWVLIRCLGVGSTIVQVCVTESVVRGDNDVVFVLLCRSL